MADKKVIPDEKVFDGVHYLSLAVAAVGTPYSQEYLSLIARRGKLPAKKLGRNWYVTREALAQYLLAHGSPAPAQVVPKDAVSGKIIDGIRYFSLAEAAIGSPHSQEYLSLLARKGKLPARKLGRNWYVTPNAIELYLSAHADESTQERTDMPVVADTPPAHSRIPRFVSTLALVLFFISGLVLTSRGNQGVPGTGTLRSILAAIGGTLNPPPGAPTGTMHSLTQLYDGIVGIFDSSSSSRIRMVH